MDTTEHATTDVTGEGDYTRGSRTTPQRQGGERKQIAKTTTFRDKAAERVWGGSAGGARARGRAAVQISIEGEWHSTRAEVAAVTPLSNERNLAYITHSNEFSARLVRRIIVADGLALRARPSRDLRSPGTLVVVVRCIAAGRAGAAGRSTRPWPRAGPPAHSPLLALDRAPLHAKITSRPPKINCITYWFTIDDEAGLSSSHRYVQSTNGMCHKQTQGSAANVTSWTKRSRPTPVTYTEHVSTVALGPPPVTHERATTHYLTRT
ncbi:hypothetical protein EVAR_45521_1 [Eumeta japonica]|uniref:Uncharacterized protein n=1 Tax=Eumeta variegata TaxID=151549 RepID=A0A4C1X6D7_EUMVA|nr:hypothetical protein EVAR_45521_1 [Eumeta japonica]